MFIKRWMSTYIVLISCFSAQHLQASSGVDGNIVDYVIVGAGTAGSLVANRLTADKKTSAIVLHSGKNFTDSFIIKYSKNTPFSVLSAFLGAPLPFDPESLDLPSGAGKELKELLSLSANGLNSLYENGLSIPQVNADNRRLLWVIGLPGGGASSVNAGIWCRGTNQLFSQWEAIAGPLWSVDRILGAYKRLEKYKGATTNVRARGYHGPVKVLQDSPPSPLAKVFTEAIIQATGFPFVLDYNDPNTPIGVSSQMQGTHRGHDGFFRVSSATAFLDHDVMKSSGRGVHNRKLQVSFESTALKVLWSGNKAIGVEYLQGGIRKQAYAKKGVIVCAGLRSSPFLMHSGIGPASLLTSLGIPVVYDNPNVGQGLADQPHVVTLYSSDPKDSFSGSNRTFSQISWLPAPGGDPISRQVRISTVDIIPGATIGIVDLCQPQSRGSVSINSADPLAPPVIDMGVLSNPNDLQLFISAFQVYVKNINTALQAINPQYRLVFPDPAILDDDALLTAFIREEVGANMHFQSHCRMAPLNQGGVVDSEGRVYGVQNLFVADNSIVPQCTDGSPMASGDLIAENFSRILGY